MLRCDQPAEGNYEVTFKYMHGQYGDESERPPDWVDFNAEIGEHGDVYERFGPGPKQGEPKRDEWYQPVVLEPGPRVMEAKPYTGELCVHELDWLRQLPGRVYGRQRRYTVRRLDGGE